jgi:myo-inositol-1(or 4)-monophosphatase
VFDLNNIKPSAETIIREVGAFILEEFTKVKPGDIAYKGLHDMVSYVDKEAEKLLVNGLSGLVPSAGFITEEGTADSNNADWEWVIDPLDGTTNYLHHLPVFAVSVALLYQRKPMMGWVFELNRNEMFFARHGKGAVCNGMPIQVSKVKVLDEGLIATGFPYYNFDKMPVYLEILNDLMQTSHGLRRMGSAAIDLVYTACGRFEGYFEYNLNPWDVAAGALIVKEAGGLVTDFSGGENYIFGREILAANALVHESLLHAVQHRWN